MNFYRYFRWLSLDIVLGAIIFLRFLGDLYGLTISATVYIALAIAIWLIYSTDHLIDSVKAGYPDGRRAFHHRYRKHIIFFSGLATVIGLIDVYYLPVEIIRAGAILAACCVTYLMAVYFVPRLWFKELIVAVGYAAGIFLAPLTLLESFHLIDLVLCSQLVVLALINLLVFSVYDQENDHKNGFGSVVLKFGPDSVKLVWVLLLLLIGSAIYFGVSVHDQYQGIQLAYLIMACMLLVVLKFDVFFRRNDRFRVIGDAVFFVPVIFLFL